jgi:hypothetical protein
MRSARRPAVDTVTNLVDGELKDTEQSVAFLSFVYPMDKWAIAGFRHQFSNFRNRTITEGPFQDLAGGPFAGAVSRINPSTGDIDLNIASYGLSVAGQLSDTFSVGAGFAVSTFSIESYGEAAIARPHDVLLPPALRPQFTATGQQFGPADYSDRSVLVTEQQFGEDTGVGFNVGALWRPSDRLSVGATFRRGPLFHFDAQFDGGPAFTEVAPGFNTALDRDTGIRFKTPDYFAVGAAISPSDAVKITFEYNRVQYSQLLNGDGNGLPVDTAGRLEFPDPAVQAEGLRVQRGLTIDDADQFRIGAEIVLVRAPTPVLFRVGTWYDPNHQIYFVDRGPDTSFNPRIQSLFVMLPQRDDEFHFSTGAGIAFSRFQIDGAIDLSPRINTASISAVFYLR